MKKENRKQQIEKDRDKFVKIYLWIFFIYVLIIFLLIFYTRYEQNLYPLEDTDFFRSTVIMGMALLSFNVYNLISLIKIIKEKWPKRYLILGLSEFIPIIFLIFEV